METSVVITLVCAAFAAWIAYLIYNYQIACINIKLGNKAKYWENRYKNVQDCITDLLDAIHEKFPKSTVQYFHNTEGVDRIEGEIKYDIR